MKLKNILLSGLSLVLVAALAIGGTVAYLQDDDSDVNVMTLGNVSIEQIEQEYNEAGKLVDFTQAKPLMPYVGTLGWKSTNNYAYRSFTMNNVVDKYVSVKNTGKSDAYVRTLIAFEMGEMTTAEWAEAIGVSINSATSTRTEFAGTWSWSAFDAAAMVIEVDGHNYVLYVATHQNAVKPGETTIPSLLQVYLSKNATNEDVEKIDGNGNGTYDILVVSQAVQVAGFADAETALNAAFGDITTTNHPWVTDAPAFNAPESDGEFEDAVKDDAKQIIVNLTGDVTYDVAAWANEAMGGEKTEYIMINGNGHTITFNQKDSDWNNIVTNGAKLIINNAKITNSGYNDGPWNRHDLNFACDVELNNVVSDKALAFKAGAKLNNVTINDANTSDTYAIWIQPNGQTVDIDGLVIDMIACSDGRGIKIDEQYVDAPQKVTLNVKNATFKTEEKAAILVKSVAGAEINLENVDITGVAADPINHVWVDEASKAYADLVTVNGGNKIVEGEQADPSTIVIIKTAEDLFAFANDVNVNGNNYSGKIVILAADIDLQNKPWTPIGQTGHPEFRGTFDGQNHTIKNLNVDNTAYTDEHTSSGLFGWAESGVTIKNLKVDCATVKGNHNVAVIVGYTYSGKISNCHVTNATIVCTHANGDACGDKCGLIAGYAGDESRFSGCTASDSTVTAGRDGGQLIGAGYNVSVSNCSASNVNVAAGGDCPKQKNINNALIGRVLG